jgi:antitoxin component YwqK of YwqJK toxin-antitoxin module
MFIRYLVLLIMVVSLASCSPKKVDNNGFSIKNNVIYKNESDKPYTGIIKAKAEGKNFEYYVKDGMKNGEFKITFENGNVIMKGNIVNDKNEGKWLYYYPSGELESEGNFKNNKADSIWTWYFPNGKIKEKGYFVEGLREGNAKMYDELGNVSMENDYKKGVGSALKNR